MMILITRDELRVAITNRAVTVVDALPAIPYSRRHLPGAGNLVEDEADVKAARFLPDPQAPIVTYSTNANCGRGDVLAEHLERLGYTAMRVYRAGIDDWVAAALPVERAAPPSTVERAP